MTGSMGSHHSARARTCVWLTPADIIRALGSFDLDPCAASVPRPWPTATLMYTAEDDGLARDWAGRVWLNPPYGPPPVIRPWMQRMARHGHGTALIFARTETEVFFETVWRAAYSVLFLKGRLHFHWPDGRRAKANAGAPSVLVAYGQRDLDRLADAGFEGALVPLKLPRGIIVRALDHTWEALALEWVRRQRGPVKVEDLYLALRSHPKARSNKHLREKVRQTLQRGHFKRLAKNQWIAA